MMHRVEVDNWCTGVQDYRCILNYKAKSYLNTKGLIKEFLKCMLLS